MKDYEKLCVIPGCKYEGKRPIYPATSLSNPIGYVCEGHWKQIKDRVKSRPL